MDTHLKSRSFFVAERYSIADIALYAYTHVAPEGGLDIAPYPNVLAWLGRVAAQPKRTAGSRRCALSTRLQLVIPPPITVSWPTRGLAWVRSRCALRIPNRHLAVHVN